MALASCENRPIGPCDIYEAGGTPCVAAHSTVRSLYSKYEGPLYQLTCGEDGETIDIYADKDGYADVETHERFCEGRVCYISVIYDQSGMENHLMQAAPGTFDGPAKGMFNTLPLADMAPVSVNGHKAYGVYIMPGMGFRNNNARGLAIEDEPEGIYSVVDGSHFDSGCCFDYGNASTNGTAVGTGTMETTYYGTSTAWGSGNGEGPWIMSDFESGLFSGYHHKVNDVPSIDSWPFVSIFVNGGGGNHWDLRGADASSDYLTIFYEGPRPHTPDSDAYYPMSKKGGLLLGNGGDNGNGSAGTFFEGAMTVGYPTDEAINLVQKNIAEQKYEKFPVSQSRLTSFSLGQTQDFEVTFSNITDKSIKGYEIRIEVPESWKVEGEPVKLIDYELLPGQSFNSAFKVTAPAGASSGYMTSIVSWGKNSEKISQRIRCSAPVKINEVYLSDSEGTENQYIELYNDSDSEVDVSGWKLDARASGYASETIAEVPENTIIKPHDFLLFRLAPSYLTTPAKKGETEIHLGKEVPGNEIFINGNINKIEKKGVPASDPTIIFIPVATGPWINIPKGSTSIPVSNADGLVAGQMMGIDWGDNYEVVKVTSVGKAATQTTLPEDVKAGQTIIKLNGTSNLEPGSILTISTGDRIEYAEVKRVILSVDSAPRHVVGRPRVRHEPGEIELMEGLKNDHMAGVDVSCLGGGVSFEPATKYDHKSGDAIQGLGLPYKLSEPLTESYAVNSSVNTVDDGYIFSNELSPRAGSLALYDGDVLVDAIVYGSKQSNSSANGTIASPELATLEGVQSQGGCIAVVPQVSRWPRREIAPEELITILARYPDGKDKDSLCEDFHPTGTPTPGNTNKTDNQ